MDLKFPFLALFLACGLLAGCVAAPAPVSPSAAELERLPVLSGVVTGHRVLRGEVHLADDVHVVPGAVLELRPGTTVYVRSAEGTQIDPEYLSSLTELLVRGRLDIHGTARRPVRFIPLTPGSPEQPAWAGITLTGAEGGKIVGARIERAETGILCIASSPEIRANLFTGNRYGIIAQQESAPRILGNRIEKGEGGIFCWRGSTPEIAGNEILDQAEEGIFADADSRPLLTGNRVSGNDLGLALYDRGLAGDPSQARGNREDLRILSRPAEAAR
ncbi:MAG: NosD domain-containing protein [Trichloromonas sp.]|jgi:parallel beta-helix repeat protein|nr:NosD domain-containing protein [Trichloromonas sp.]